ncbi:histidine kinase [Enterovirga rhinocerotis]|uniref:Uncharacterized protein n=1 Tax=Enterovirga rhinocerotis TaxID=1339210 RepID=A0A4R7BUS4_9HYPH|nr:histidine kinase [Enterovirga rhinocerotis]TDR89251.1 hypothetical protein EV668_3741 [Enterovirga rhinocerotis]
MADYYPLLARALDGLSDNTPDTRALVFDRARAALTSQLRAVQPPLADEELAREIASLDEAISRAERAYSASERSAAAPLPPEPPEPAVEPVRPRVGGTPIRSPRRGRSLLTAFGLVAVIVPLAVAAWLWRDKPAAPSEVATSRPVETQPAPAPSEPKFPERVGGEPAPESGGAAKPTQAPPASKPPAAAAPAAEVPVAQKAALVEENTQDPQQPKVTSGRALWRLDAFNPGQGQPLETAVRATVEIPDAGLVLHLTLRKNLDKSLPASHTMELAFTTSPAGDTNKMVRDVNPPLFRADDSARGLPVAALSVPVKENLFLIGLSDLRGDLERNAELIRNRNWIEVPLRFASGTRATLVFEKGVGGNRVIEEAYKAWGQP